MNNISIAGKQRSSTLIHYGSSQFFRAKMGAIKNDPQKPHKPKRGTGLWVSPFHSEYGWSAWCRGQGIKSCTPENSFMISLNPDARVFVIDEPNDLSDAPSYIDQYGFPALDFEAIANDYDAIWMTMDGVFSSGKNSIFDLWGWDCETVLLMNADCFHTYRPLVNYQWLSYE